MADLGVRVHSDVKHLGGTPHLDGVFACLITFSRIQGLSRAEHNLVGTLSSHCTLIIEVAHEREALGAFFIREVLVIIFLHVVVAIATVITIAVVWVVGVIRIVRTIWAV